MVDVGLEPTTQKTHGLSTTPFVKGISEVLVRLTTCKRLTNSLPKLSLINSCTLEPEHVLDRGATQYILEKTSTFLHPPLCLPCLR